MYLLFFSIMFAFCSVIFFLSRKKIILSIVSTILLFVSLYADKIFNGNTINGISTENIFYIIVLTSTIILMVFSLIKSTKKFITPNEMKNHLLIKNETNVDSFNDGRFFG